MQADWRDVLRTGNEISGDHGFTHTCRAADICHAAYALELAADLFVTFDKDQAKLATATDYSRYSEVIAGCCTRKSGKVTCRFFETDD